MKDILRFLNSKGCTPIQHSHMIWSFTHDKYRIIIERSTNGISYYVSKEYRTTGESCSPIIARDSQRAIIQFLDSYVF